MVKKTPKPENDLPRFTHLNLGGDEFQQARVWMIASLMNDVTVMLDYLAERSIGLSVRPRLDGTIYVTASYYYGKEGKFSKAVGWNAPGWRSGLVVACWLASRRETLGAWPLFEQKALFDESTFIPPDL